MTADSGLLTPYKAPPDSQESWSDAYLRALHRAGQRFHQPKLALSLHTPPAWAGIDPGERAVYAGALGRELSILAAHLSPQCVLQQLSVGAGEIAYLQQDHLQRIVGQILTAFRVAPVWGREFWVTQGPEDAGQSDDHRDQPVDYDFLAGLGFGHVQLDNGDGAGLEAAGVQIQACRYAGFQCVDLRCSAPVANRLAWKPEKITFRQDCTWQSWAELDDYRHVAAKEFVRKDSSFGRALQKGALSPNRLGYTTCNPEITLAVGVGGVSELGAMRVVNHVDPDPYTASLELHQMPVASGTTLSVDHQLRRFVKRMLGSRFCLDLQEFSKLSGQHFADYFVPEWAVLDELSRQDLVVIDDRQITVTPLGKYWVRDIEALFDGCLPTVSLSQQARLA